MRRFLSPRYITPYAVVIGLTALALLYIPALEAIRTPGLTVIAIGAAIVIGQIEYRRLRAERLIASLNGRLLKLTNALSELRAFIGEDTFRALPRADRQRLRRVESDLGNLAAIIQGFRDLDEYIEEVTERVTRAHDD